MFDMNDFDNIKKPSERKEAPDYMINDEDFLNQMMTVTRVIKETDFDNHESRASFLMHMMNMSINKPNEKNETSLDIVSALATHIIVMMQAINGGKESYFEHFDTNVIFPMISDGANMPIWNDEE